MDMTMPIPAHVIAEARREAFIHLRQKDLPLRRPILCDGQVVGFCHPHSTPRGFRLGPIFVLASFRGRGLTRQAYEKHAGGRVCIAFIHEGNHGSERAHAAAGFTRGAKRGGGWFWHRSAST